MVKHVISHYGNTLEPLDYSMSVFNQTYTIKFYNYYHNNSSEYYTIEDNPVFLPGEISQEEKSTVSDEINRFSVMSFTKTLEFFTKFTNYQKSKNY